MPLAVFLAYIAGACLLGEFGPFTRWDMYSKVEPRWSSLVIFADGKPADLFRFTGFYPPPAGLTPERTGFDASEHYSLNEIRSYISSHSARALSGPVQIEVAGYRVHWDRETDAVITDKTTLYVGQAQRLR